jgi:hypothetical protein
MASPRPIGVAAVKEIFPGLFAICAVLLAPWLWLAVPIAAQSPSLERVFQHSKPEVERAVEEIHATVGGRLPILDGFVDQKDQAVDHYERGYYQCVVQVISAAQGQTLVRVSAKITAWYADPNPAQSGYRVLPSNGRLETDLLDRLGEALAAKTASPATVREERTIDTQRSPPAPVPAQSMGKTPPPAVSLTLPSASPLGPPALDRPLPRAEPLAPAPTEADLNLAKQQRSETEKRIEGLSSEARNLEEILHNQAHPTDLAIVRKPGTPVMARPQADSPMLFSADAEDEFQILGNQGTWVHVQISGTSRGWILRADLDSPGGPADNSNKVGGSNATRAPVFHVAREETDNFAGDWKPLNGKAVRIIWTEPASTLGKSSAGSARREFAKSVFLKAYSEISSSQQTVAGVVVVFDTPDGGQIAVTLETLRLWQGGSLSESSFWEQCSIDPPELFESPARN